jgi:ABC-type multidrug transport system fused ATPase/permease subunit
VLLLLRYAYSVSREKTLATAILAVVGSLTTVALTYLLGQVVAAAADVGAGGPLHRFVWLVSVTAAVFLLDSLLPVLRQGATTALEQRVARAVGTRVVEPMLAPSRVSHLDDPVVLDEFGRATTEAQADVSAGASYAMGLVSARVALAGSVALVGALFHWWVALTLLAAGLGLAWWVIGLNTREGEAWSNKTEGHRQATYAFDLSMSEAAKEIRIFDLAEWLAARHTRWLTDTYAAVWSSRWRSAAHNLGFLAAHTAVYVAAMLYAARAAWRGELSLAHAVTVVTAIFAVGLGFSPTMTWNARRAAATLRAMDRIAPVIAERHPEPAGRSVDWSGAPHREIRFDDVSFRYPGADRDVLRGVNLTIRAGEAVALVGVNGAGKSTLVKLLCGAYAPTTGRITVDGVDLASVDAASLNRWQRQVASITQDFLRLPLSARDNVSLNHVDERDLALAAARAGIGDLLDGLPTGWDTPLDKSLPGGVDLSGGQWQRIALARALLAVDAGARVLVLDEPAAALDVRAEASLVENYLDLTQGISSLIISHRFSVVRGADRIHVLSAGRIIESGSHDELISAGGRYAAMFTTQARRYVADKEEPDA